MASLKSGLTRTLRSKIIASNQRKFGDAGHAGHAIVGAGATRMVTSTGIAKPHILTPFISSDFRTPTNHQSRTSPPPKLRAQSTPFDTLLNNLTSHLTSTPPASLSPTLPHLFSLLRTYDSDPNHWAKFAHANPAKQYTRNLVCEVPGIFNLLLLVWTPGKKSPVHDHADAHCLMKILQGSLVETRYAIPSRPGEEGALAETSKSGFRTGKVGYMADSLGLHSISNPDPTDYAVSLHLYTPPNAAMRGCHVYDEENGEARHVMQGAYDSVAGKVTK